MVFFLVAVFGASVQEIVHWYELRQNLQEQKYSALLHDPLYWLAVIAMSLASGLGTWIWLYSGPPEPLRQYLLIGAAFPLILKKATAALVSRETTLGDDDGLEPPETPFNKLHDYLLIPEIPR